MNWSNIKTYGALTLVSLLYGINYSILKIMIPEYIGAFGFIVFRVTLAAMIFWIIFSFNAEKVDWKKDWLRLGSCALFGITINQLLFYKGISLTSAVNGSIIMTLTPILVLFWAAILIGERITKLKIFGILIGLLGALIIIYQPSELVSYGDWKGDILVFLNACSYAGYLVIVKPLMKKYRPLTVVTWVFTIGAILVLPAGLSEAVVVDFGSLPPKVWYGIIYTVIGVTVINYFLNIWALIKVESSVVGAFVYLQPVFATLTAVLFFNEVFLWKHLLASAFVFLGVWLVTKNEGTSTSN